MPGFPTSDSGIGTCRRRAAASGESTHHKPYVIIAEDPLPNGDQGAAPSGGDGEWTEAKNARRFALVDKQIEGTILKEEAVELQHLQQQLDEYLRRVAPLPLSAARELHEQLRQSPGSSPAP